MIEAIFWLALNVYHEARNQEQLDQIAVAHVVINRSKSRSLPIKQVIFQPFQFSWTFQKEDYFPHDTKAFLECTKSAIAAVEGRDFTGGALYYHNINMIPEWSNRLEYTSTYGAHSFYKELN